jgi:1,4-dihydroxy-2-naphthoate octaprenyltransferase
MSGWKTYTAAILSILYGVFFCGFYQNNWSEAITYVLAGLGLLGIGNKLEKIKNKL